METTHLDIDIKVLYVHATSFPDGIKPAHEKLHSVVPFSTNRKYFGLSRQENGVIIYKAAAEELNEGEAEKFNLPTMIVRKGNYISVDITDYMKDIPAIGKTFQELLSHPGIDPEGYCFEWYLSMKDMRCMVRLQDE
jgi:hypothetical protein